MGFCVYLMDMTDSKLEMQSQHIQSVEGYHLKTKVENLQNEVLTSDFSKVVLSVVFNLNKRPYFESGYSYGFYVFELVRSEPS